MHNDIPGSIQADPFFIPCLCEIPLDQGLPLVRGKQVSKVPGRVAAVFHNLGKQEAFERGVFSIQAIQKLLGGKMVVPPEALAHDDPGALEPGVSCLRVSLRIGRRCLSLGSFEDSLSLIRVSSLSTRSVWLRNSISTV